MFVRSLRLMLVCSVLAGLLVACANPPKKAPAETPAASAPAPAPEVAPPPPPPPPPAPVPEEPSATEKALTAGLAAYERGEYGNAIKFLNPLTTDASVDVAVQVRALKTQAFSQCLTRAITLCRKSFEQAFKLDPNFDLAPAERGHPVWGREFERVKKAATAGAKGK
jgi:hypothetical protein